MSMLNRMRESALYGSVARSIARHRWRQSRSSPALRDVMQVSISLSLLLVSLFVLLTPGEDQWVRELASGWIGGLMVYWLRR